MNCPRCSGVCRVEIMEGVEIDRCQLCDGVWLDKDELLPIIRNEEEKFSEDLIKETLKTASKGVPEEEVKNVLYCPKCKSAMRPINYDYSSGIIIDACPSGHGLWFDKDELSKVQIYREKSKDEFEEHIDEWSKLVSGAEGLEQGKINSMKQDGKGISNFIFNAIFRRFAG